MLERADVTGALQQPELDAQFTRERSGACKAKPRWMGVPKPRHLKFTV